MATRKLPSGVGFGFTQLIQGGFLDDVLDVIMMHIRERKAAIKRDRANRS